MIIARQNTEIYQTTSALNLQSPRVLQLDVQGTPTAWISIAQAASHASRDAIAWQDGHTPLCRLRGGFNAVRGTQSILDIYPIIALQGCAKINLFDVVPALTREKLIRRDRNMCAYCGQLFSDSALQCEHIFPQSRGGATSWMNLVAACGACNVRKAARTPEEARMPLLYLPYQPSRFEDFLLANRNIRADVQQWLGARLPKHSRLLVH